jgi:hypothetical protein
VGSSYRFPESGERQWLADSGSCSTESPVAKEGGFRIADSNGFACDGFYASRLNWKKKTVFIARTAIDFRLLDPSAVEKTIAEAGRHFEKWFFGKLCG